MHTRFVLLRAAPLLLGDPLSDHQLSRAHDSAEPKVWKARGRDEVIDLPALLAIAKDIGGNGFGALQDVACDRLVLMRHVRHVLLRLVSASASGTMVCSEIPPYWR